MVRKKENEENEAKLSKDDWDLIGFVEVMFAISIICGFLTNIIIKVEKEIITDVSTTIMVTSAALITFVAIFYIFRLRILTENKRNCGYRKRIFKEKLEDVLGKDKILELKDALKDVLGKDKIPDNAQEIKKQWEKINEQWGKIKGSFIIFEKQGEERYKEIFNEVGRKTLPQLYERYDEIMKKFQKVNKGFRWSLWLAFFVISSSFLSLIFKICNSPNFILFSIFIFMNLMFVTFIVVIIYYIPNILEIWVKETEDKK